MITNFDVNRWRSPWWPSRRWRCCHL